MRTPNAAPTGALLKLQEPVMWGGPSAWRTRRKGDVCVAFHWVTGEPAAVFYLYSPRVTLGYGRRAVYVLPLEAAHTLVRAETGGQGVDVDAVVRKAMTAARVFGRENDREVARQVADLMLESIDDLLDMPPEPPSVQRKLAPTAEATFTVAGDTVFEGEV